MKNKKNIIFTTILLSLMLSSCNTEQKQNFPQTTEETLVSSVANIIITNHETEV